MSAKNHVFTEGENKNLIKYREATKGQPVRKNLIKLIRHVNMLNPFPTEESWEYIMFNRLLSDEMIDVCLSMKLRTPYDISELAGKNKRSVEEMAKLAHEMVSIGIIEYCTGEDGIDRVQLPVFAPGSMENTCYTPEILEKCPEEAPGFLNYILDLQKMIAPMMPMGQALMRAIPVEAAIQGDSRKVPTDECKYWLDKNGESIGVGYCECRRLRRMVGEGTADLEGEWCISIGALAESLIRVGKHRRITREEAEKILREAEQKGYVHQLSNIDGPDHSIFICNCAWDTCMALKTSWYTSSPNLSASNYRAHVDGEKCVACGGCVEVCPQGAVRLGEKLCTKEHITIEPRPIPHDTVPFTKKYWWGNDFLTERKFTYDETGTAPCKTSCPAHVAVQGYLKLAAQGRYADALELIKKENPFPAVCGSICHRYCEKECTRGLFDAPVAIDEVKKFIAEQELKSENRFVPQKYYNFGHKVAVIGAGPAGLSCAYYLAIMGHDVTVFDKNNLPGGMMMYGIPTFRLNKKLVSAEIDILKELGVKFRMGVEVGKDVTIPQLREQGFKGFYVAIGLQNGGKLGIPGDDAQGVMSGIDFIRPVNEAGKGSVSGKVVVIGGGNIGADVARTVLRCGAESVDLYCLESYDEMPCGVEDRTEVESEGITIHAGWGQTEIHTEDGKCKAISFRRCLSVKNAEGRFAPVFDDSETITAEADMVLYCIGQRIQWNDLLKDTAVEFNRNGTAIADPVTLQTAEPDIFVGGDCYTGQKFVIDAIAAGKQGADSLHRYVHEGHSLTLGRMKRNAETFKMIDKTNIDVKEYNKTPRQVPAVAKTVSFDDPRSSLTEEQVKAETARCLSCGKAIVDTSFCIGCGLCTVRCKFDAITLYRDRNDYGVVYEKLPLAVVKEEAARFGRAMAKPFKGKKDINK